MFRRFIFLSPFAIVLFDLSVLIPLSGSLSLVFHPHRLGAHMDRGLAIERLRPFMISAFKSGLTLLFQGQIGDFEPLCFLMKPRTVQSLRSESRPSLAPMLQLFLLCPNRDSFCRILSGPISRIVVMM